LEQALDCTNNEDLQMRLLPRRIALATLSLAACQPEGSHRAIRVDSASVWAPPASRSAVRRTSDTVNGQFWVLGDRGEAARAAGRAYGWAYYFTDLDMPGAAPRDSIPEIPLEDFPRQAAVAVARRVRELGFSSRCTRVFGPIDGAFQVELHPWCPRRYSHEPYMFAAVTADGQVRESRSPLLGKGRRWVATCPGERDSTRLAIHLVSVGSSPGC
jgi:hypothetical protein